jgi:anti-sigma factor RsiW
MVANVFEDTQTFMTCQEIESFIYPYLDGEFEPGERLEFEEHLATCQDCARKVHSQDRLREAVRKAGRKSVVVAPERLSRSIQAGLMQQSRRARLTFFGQLGAAAAVLVMVAGAYLALRPGSGVRFVEAAVQSHAKWLPLEIHQAPPENYARWFVGKLEHPVPVLQFPNATLAGARLSHVADKPAAYMAYDTGSGDRRIGLFVIDDTKREIPAKPLPSLNLDSSHGYNVAVWRDREIVYELVTDLDEEDIRSMLRGATNALHPRSSPPAPSGSIFRSVSTQDQ